jgi:catechol 2,3-dioxygenase-like lactoylglutathione lyase family enzyme
MMHSRRRALQALGIAAAGAPLSVFAQGRCMLTFGTPACNTTDIKPIFEPTGWKTMALDHLTFRVADYQKEAAFYIALMGWTLRSDDGKQAVLDMGDWGSAIFKRAAQERWMLRPGTVVADAVARAAVMESFSFAIDQERQEGRGGAPEARHDPGGRQRRKGFELPREGSRWVGSSDQQRQWPREEPQRRAGERQAVGACSVRVDGVENGVVGPSLVQRAQLQGKRFLLQQSPWDGRRRTTRVVRTS